LNGAVASRYAAALVDVAMERKIDERVKRDLASFTDAYESSADLRNVLENPSVARETKLQVIRKLSERMDLAPAMRNFLSLLADHRRTEMLPEIQQAFRTDWNARNGVLEAEITSAQPMSTENRKEMIGKLEKDLQQKIEAHFREDGSLIGGTVVRLGSTVYDNSIRARLNRMREQLEAE